MAEIILRSQVQRKTAIDLIGSLDLSRPWRITVVRYVQRRSLGQNALLHKWFGMIADELGDDPEDVKMFFKERFAPKTELEIGGEVRLVPMSTAKMDSPTMSMFMERVYQFTVSQIGMVLPVPEMQHEGLP